MTSVPRSLSRGRRGSPRFRTPPTRVGTGPARDLGGEPPAGSDCDDVRPRPGGSQARGPSCSPKDTLGPGAGTPRPCSGGGRGQAASTQPLLPQARQAPRRGSAPGAPASAQTCFHRGPGGVGGVAELGEARAAVGAVGVVAVEGAGRRRRLVGPSGRVVGPVDLALVGVGAEAAAAAAQAGRRGLAVRAAPVRLLPVRVPGRLGLVVEAAGKAGVVPPVVVVLLGPGEQRAGAEPSLGETPGPRNPPRTRCPESGPGLQRALRGPGPSSDPALRHRGRRCRLPPPEGEGGRGDLLQRGLPQPPERAAGVPPPPPEPEPDPAGAGMRYKDRHSSDLLPGSPLPEGTSPTCHHKHGFLSCRPRTRLRTNTSGRRCGDPGPGGRSGTDPSGLGLQARGAWVHTTRKGHPRTQQCFPPPRGTTVPPKISRTPGNGGETEDLA